MRFARLTEPFRWKYAQAPFDIGEWLRKELYVYDADICGHDVSFWVVTSAWGEPRFYRCEHSWYIEHNPEWDIVNSFEIEEVGRDALDAKATRSLREVT